MPDAAATRAWSYLKDWAPALLWAAVIFLFSGDMFSSQNMARTLLPWLEWLLSTWSATGIERLHLLIRKLGHFSEYFVFALLLMRAFHGQAQRALGRKHLCRCTGVLILYAISDELHQALVPSRSASVIDVLIDACGGLAGAITFYLWQPRAKQVKLKQSP